MAARNVHAGIGVDATDLKKLSQALRKASPVAGRELRLKMREVGEIVARDAREKASEHSKTIAPTIKVRTAGLTVSVQAGNKDSPLAELYELGGKGMRPGSWRHPVFGNKEVWVTQKGYPFLEPSVLEKAPEALAKAEEVLDDLAKVLTTG